MTILLLNQFFWPDSSATSQLLTDLARGLAERGHVIHTISAGGGYAPDDKGTPPAVHMHHVKSLPFVRGKLGRVLSYATFALSATWRALTMPKVDIVLTCTTPPLLSLLGNAVKKFRGSQHFIWEKDMYPDVAVDCGVLKAHGLLDRMIGGIADWSRNQADGIIAIGECMRDRLVARGIASDKIVIAYDWADSDAITALPFHQTAERFTVLYSGNLGLAHDLATITTSMRELRSDSRFRFVFVGSGGRRDELSSFAAMEGLTSVEMRPYVERGNLGENLALGDVGLVTQKDICCGSVVPSKVYGILAAGRPVLFIGPANAMPARIIRQFNCGWHVPVGESETLTKLLVHLADHPEIIETAGSRARQALVSNFDLGLGVARVATILESGIPGTQAVSPMSSATSPLRNSPQMRT